jgi:hypothetical protein
MSHGPADDEQAVHAEGIAVLRIVDGKILEVWRPEDRLGLMRQGLGAGPTWARGRRPHVTWSRGRSRRQRGQASAGAGGGT